MASNKVRFFVNKRPRELIESVVERNGTRAIDNGVFTIPRNTPITRGDSVAYLQDPTNIRYLVGIWNFFDSTRDEGGYELDGAEDATFVTDAGYSDGCDGRVINFTSATKAVKIANNSDKMAFDGKFDIIIWFNNTQTSSNGGHLFSKGDGTNYIEIKVANSSGGVQRANATIKLGSSTTNFNGTKINIHGDPSNNSTDSYHFHFIRLKRDESNLVTFSVDGITEGTPTKITGNISSSSALYIGDNVQDVGNDIPKCRISQVRLYSGGYVSDDEYTVLRQTKRQPSTIKFGGVIWKIDEKPTYRVIHCKGHAKILHEIEVDISDSSPTWTESGDIFRNIYKNKTGFEILKNIIPAYDSTYEVVDPHSSLRVDYEEYTAVGTLYQNVLVLTINGTNDSSFSIDARKTLRLEKDTLDYYSGSSDHSKFSPIIFKEGTTVKVKDLGYDDSTLTTQLTALTNLITRVNTITTPRSSFQDAGSTNKTMRISTASQTTSISAIPIDPQKVTLSHSSQGALTNKTYIATPSGNTEFVVERDSTNGQRVNVVLGTAGEASGDYTATFDYKDYTNNHYYTSSSDPDNVGVFAKTIYLPQLTKVTGNMKLTGWVGKYLTKFKNLNRRFTVEVPTLVNHVRENYKVRVIDRVHGAETAQNLKVQSMKYYYPEGKTEINLGEHFLDSYDLDNAFGSALHEIRSTLSQTQPI